MAEIISIATPKERLLATARAARSTTEMNEFHERFSRAARALSGSERHEVIEAALDRFCQLNWQEVHHG